MPTFSLVLGLHSFSLLHGAQCPMQYSIIISILLEIDFTSRFRPLYTTLCYLPLPSVLATQFIRQPFWCMHVATLISMVTFVPWIHSITTCKSLPLSITRFLDLRREFMALPILSRDLASRDLLVTSNRVFVLYYSSIRSYALSLV